MELDSNSSDQINEVLITGRGTNGAISPPRWITRVFAEDKRRFGRYFISEVVDPEAQGDFDGNASKPRVLGHDITNEATPR